MLRQLAFVGVVIFGLWLLSLIVRENAGKQEGGPAAEDPKRWHKHFDDPV